MHFRIKTPNGIPVIIISIRLNDISVVLMKIPVLMTGLMDSGHHKLYFFSLRTTVDWFTFKYSAI